MDLANVDPLQMLGQNADFVREVVGFIDAPLTLESLRRLRAECSRRRQQQSSPARDEAETSEPSLCSVMAHSSGSPCLPAAAAPAGDAPDPAAASPAPGDLSPAPAPAPSASPAGDPQLPSDLPVGCAAELRGLSRNSAYNGRRAVVVGHEGSEVLVVLTGAGDGKVFGVAPANLHRCSAAVGRGSYAGELAERLRRALRQVALAPLASVTAASLYVVDPEALFAVLREFQPQLSDDTLRRSWRRVVQICQEHGAASAAATPVVQPPPSPPPRAPLPLPPPPAAAAPLPAPDAAAGAERVAGSSPAPADELLGQLQEVLAFIDEPLSPQALSRMQRIKRGASQSQSPPR